MKGGERIGVDTNVLVFADDASNPHYSKAKGYLEDAIKGDITLCLSHQILAEYFSVITNPQRVRQPLSVEEAKERVLFLNRTRRIKKIYPKRSTLKRCIEFCAKNQIYGIQVFDVYFATVLLDNNIHKLITQNTKDFRYL